MVARPKEPRIAELQALVAELQAQVRELIAENEALRRGAFTRWNEPVPGETEEERRERIARDPRVTTYRRPAGPLPPYQPVPGEGQMDVLKLLGRREDSDDETGG
jgi:hypothetical protein